MRRIITAAAGAAAAALLAAGCGSSSTSTPPQPAVSAQPGQAGSSEAPLSPLGQCVRAVDQLLIQDLDAIEAGYPGGIDTTQVMDRYGALSAIFQAFVQLQAQLASQVAEYGTTNALAPVGRQVVATCQEYGAGSQQPAVPAPSPSPQTTAAAVPASAPASPIPSANARGCPSSAQLLAAWAAAPPAVRQTPLSPSGMSDITCWRAWAVASPVWQANGLVVFYEQDGQWHLLPETELSQFDAAVCGSPDAPPAWSNPADGPATCS
jgi:hypothetical protein